jgi:hypothetical protein
MSDSIVIEIANEPYALPAIRLLVGAAAVRVDLSLEQIDELQLAIETVLAAGTPGASLTLEIEPGEAALEVRIGPVEPSVSAVGLPLQRVLGALADAAEPFSTDGAPWLRVEKRRPVPGAGAGV